MERVLEDSGCVFLIVSVFKSSVDSDTRRATHSGHKEDTWMPDPYKAETPKETGDTETTKGHQDH